MDYLNLRKIADDALNNTDGKTLTYTDELLRGILAIMLYNLIIRSSEKSSYGYQVSGGYGEDRFGNQVGSSSR